MKRILALILTLALFAGVLTACASKADVPEAVEPEAPVVEETPAEPEAPAEEMPAEDASLSTRLTTLFYQLVEASPELDCEGMANELVMSELLSGMELNTYNHLDAEFMVGFGEGFAPEAFQKASYIGTMDSTVFLAYVFDLNEGTDGDVFAAYLEESADPAWNGSGTADQVTAAVVGSKVLFVMCSEQEQETVDYNQQLVDRFHEYMASSEDASAESIAAYLCQLEGFPLDLAATPVEGGWLAGLDEFDQFEDGAMFAPMIGSIPFVGYVFAIGQDVDAGEFIATLEAQANPRWNVCTEADCVITQSFQDETRNVVLFFMAPAAY